MKYHFSLINDKLKNIYYSVELQRVLRNWETPSGNIHQDKLGRLPGWSQRPHVAGCVTTEKLLKPAP